MGHHIRDYGTHKLVPIYQDYNVADGQQVYIGNGQGCRTFWFSDVEEAKRFIDAHSSKIEMTKQAVINLIPKELCEGCKGHYSYGTPEWKRAKDRNCREFKEQMKDAVPRPL